MRIILIGLRTLFLMPNQDDGNYKEATDLLRNEPEKFKELVKKSLHGESIDGRIYEKFIYIFMLLV